MNLARTRLDWSTDVIKHYVRRQAWLPAALDQVEASRNSGREPKYLTFCAAEAIDVFLFLKEGVLTRNPETDRVLNTYFCEQNEQDFNEISQLIGAHDQGFFGDFKDMMLFEDDEQTQDLKYDDVSRRYSPELRRRLSMKMRHERFKSLVPFDVINLDVYGTFFPPKTGVLSPMLRSIRTLLDWQTEPAQGDMGLDSFTVFLTAHVECGRINDKAMKELVRMVETNQRAYVGFASALKQRFGTNDLDNIATDDFLNFYCIALPKLIVSEAFQRGWQARARFSGRYQRVRETSAGATSTKYSMLAWVGRFYRHRPEQLKLGLTQAPSVRDYAQLIGELTDEPEDVDLATSRVREETEADLERIVSFRDDYLAGIRRGAKSTDP